MKDANRAAKDAIKSAQRKSPAPELLSVAKPDLESRVATVIESFFLIFLMFVLYVKFSLCHTLLMMLNLFSRVLFARHLLYYSRA